MMKVKNLVSSFGVAILPFLSQVTVNASSGITFSSSDVATVNSAISTWAGSIFDMIIQFGPILIGILAIFIILKVFKIY